MKSIHEKIKRLKELKRNPIADQNTIIRLKQELEWVDLNSLSIEERKELQTLFS